MGAGTRSRAPRFIPARCSEGIIVKPADFGASTTFRVGVAFDHSGKYTAVGPFDYAGS